MKYPVALTSILLCIALCSPSLYGQHKKKSKTNTTNSVKAVVKRGFETTLTFSDTAGQPVGQPLKFGVNLDATYCVDMSLGESFVPPLPPRGIGDIRFVDPRDGTSCMDLGISNDFRPFINTAQVDTYMVHVQTSTNGFPLRVSWSKLNKFYAGSVMLTDPFGGVVLKADMKKESSAIIKRDIGDLIIIAHKPVNPMKVK